MARYRNVHVKIWRDPDFQEYSPSGKLIFIYLLTNPDLGESGIYAVTPKTISRETGLRERQVTDIVTKQLKNVLYDEPTNTVFLAKYLAYSSLGGRNDLRWKAIKNERATTPSPLWKKFDEAYSFSEEEGIIYRGLATPFKGNNNTNPNNNLKHKKEVNKVSAEIEAVIGAWQARPNLTQPRKITKDIRTAVKYRLGEGATTEEIDGILAWYVAQIENPTTFWGGDNRDGRPIKFNIIRVMKGKLADRITFVYEHFLAESKTRKGTLRRTGRKFNGASGDPEDFIR